MNLGFTNGAQSGAGWSDAAGQPAMSMAQPAGWTGREADMSAYAGLGITTFGLAATTAPGQPWDIWNGDIAIVSLDGTVVSIYNRQQGVSPGLASTSGSPTGLSAFTEVPNNITTAVTPHWVTTYYADDHLGTSRMEFAGGGWPVWSGTFAPYGQEVNAQASPNNYMLTGPHRVG